ncbi:MAG: hypothetical protein HQK68_03080 [Desulfamplus sp.]|nr:hypothetical protein [Desulfamplus sp.]
MSRFESELGVYAKRLSVGYSTIGKQGLLKIVSIMNYLQDTASEHAHLIGRSGFDLADENLGWVIFRYHIEIKDHPCWQDEIIVRTRRFSCKNLYEIRLFNITKDKEELVNARGCWVMVNKKSGRPVRLSRFNTEQGNSDPETNYFENSSVGLESYFSEVIRVKVPHYKLQFKVETHDLDLNGHVNNAIFVKWGVESVPESILANFFPAKIDVIFNKESLYGDQIIAQTEICEVSGLPLTLHSIIREQDNVELANINICWQRYVTNYVR